MKNESLGPVASRWCGLVVRPSGVMVHENRDYLAMLIWAARRNGQAHLLPELIALRRRRQRNSGGAAPGDSE